MLCEPGEEFLPITSENFVLQARGSCAQLQAWDEKRNLVRRIVGIQRETRGKLVLKIERFGKLQGAIELIDRRRAERDNVPLRSARLSFREQFRRFLRRQFPLYKIAELTTETDLEHTLSPVYPRALLRQGSLAWAAIGAAPDFGYPDGVLTFGLIWLDYLRRREPSLVMQGLVLYLPASATNTTCLRLLFLDPNAAQYLTFAYDDSADVSAAVEEQLDLKNYGNLNTYLEPYCRRTFNCPLGSHPDIEVIERSDSELSFRVRGLEFARTAGPELLVGLDHKTRADSQTAGRWADELGRLRSPSASDTQNPLYRRNPEAWLESQVRSRIQEIDASLLPNPVYGQVPAFAAADRGVLDLLAIDHRGRLAVLELKASEDVHLPLQALDYWMRVQWHVHRGTFQAKGYFPGNELARESPRLLLVSPALDVHPSNDIVVRYFSPQIPVERIGVALEWRKELKVMHRSGTL